MLDPQLLRTDAHTVAQQLLKKRHPFDAEEYLQLEEERKRVQVLTQELQATRNARSKEIGQLKSRGEDASGVMQEVAGLADELKAAQAELEAVQAAMQTIALGLPNVPHESVPEGNSEEDNEEVSRWGTPPSFDFDVHDHVDVGQGLNALDFESAVTIAGSRFVVIKGQLARLQRAITQYMLDKHTEQHGYTEVYVPYLANSASLQGTGQLPKFLDDQFKTQTEDDLFLIPTAEVPVTNLVRDQIVATDGLPMKFVAHTPCFRL